MKAMIRLAIATLFVAAASRAGAQQPTAVIPPLRGHVQSPEGRPLADAEVRVEGVKGSARSDALGLFSLPNVPKGIQTISIRRIGYLPAVAVVEISPGNDSLIVTLVPMHTVLDTVKVVAEMNVLAGIVVDEHNRPISGASVDLIGNRRGSATTGVDGWFNFTSVRNGPTILHVVKTGYVGTMQSVQLTDWRGVVVQLSLIDTTLSRTKQEILSGTGNSATFIWHETQTRLAQRRMNAVVVTREELAPLSDLTLGEAIRRAPSASSLSSDLQVINNTVCILLNGNRAVGQQSLDVYDTDDVEFVELYPPEAEPSGSVAAYLRFATCPTTRTRANGKTGIFYAVIWLKN
jgi:hypothetical protein